MPPTSWIGGDGSNTSWNNPTNWVDDLLPISGSILVFDDVGIANTTTVNDFDPQSLPIHRDRQEQRLHRLQLHRQQPQFDLEQFDDQTPAPRVRKSSASISPVAGGITITNGHVSLTGSASSYNGSTLVSGSSLDPDRYQQHRPGQHHRHHHGFQFRHSQALQRHYHHRRKPLSLAGNLTNLDSIRFTTAM